LEKGNDQEGKGEMRFHRALQGRDKRREEKRDMELRARGEESATMFSHWLVRVN
jgi:hypothetical protein